MSENKVTRNLFTRKFSERKKGKLRYYFYHNSPLNHANLKQSYQSLDKAPLRPTRVGGTCWVDHVLKALDHFLRGYQAIVQHLEQMQSPDVAGARGDQKAKAKQFFKTATSLNVIKYACFCLIH